MRQSRTTRRGFTLVELMIVVAIVAILSTLAIYGVGKYVSNAKTTEARNTLGQLSKDAAAAYIRETMAGNVLTLGSTAAKSSALCASAAAPVPATAADIKGKKYQSTPAEWNTSDASTGWACVRFSMQDPQYYQYNYAQAGSRSEVGGTFTTSATGDLDGDSVTSSYTFVGGLVPDGDDIVLAVAPNIDEVNGLE